MSNDEIIKEMCPILYLYKKCFTLQKEHKDSYYADREMWDFIDILSCKKNLPDHIFYDCKKCKKWENKNECWDKYLEFGILIHI